MHWWRRCACRRGDLRRLILVLSGLLVALVLCNVLDARLRPVAVTLARTELDNQVSAAVNEVCAELVEGGALCYEDIITSHYDPASRLTELTTNMKMLNSVRVQVGKAVSARIEGKTPSFVRVPLGAVLHWNLLTGLGIPVKVPILHVGMMGTTFESHFSSAGVNQTLHRIDMVVRVQAVLFLPAGIAEQSVSYTVPLAQSLLVGEVPQSYTNLTRAFDQASDSNATEE